MTGSWVGLQLPLTRLAYFKNMIVALKKPIVFFDIEGTGLSPERDHIVSVALLKVTSQASSGTWLNVVCNPGVIMSDETVAIHGITNESVADKPMFPAVAATVFSFVNGCDLAGYNLLNYDVPILWEEFYRAGLTWDLQDCQMIDIGNIFKKKEQRSLSAAVEFYCGRRHENAHEAQSDAQATLDVLEAQLQRYPDLSEMTVREMSEYSRLDKLPRVDLAGKIAIDASGDYVYGLHSKRGVKVKDDPSFGDWMLRKDFSQNTKMHLRRILDDLIPNSNSAWDESDVPYDSNDIPFGAPVYRKLLSPNDDDEAPF